MSVLFSFIIIAILILINGLFVAAEFGIIGVRPTRVAQLAATGTAQPGNVQILLGHAVHFNSLLVVSIHSTFANRPAKHKPAAGLSLSPGPAGR